MTYLILAQSEVTARALGAWLELLGAPGVTHPRTDGRCIVREPPIFGGREASMLLYEEVVATIDKIAVDSDGNLPLNRVIVLVDSVTSEGLTPLREDGNWDGLIAMLVLTFPEIRWVFGVIRGEPGRTQLGESRGAVEATKQPGPDCGFNVEWAWHELPSLLSHPRRDPLFDPTGLREWIRWQASTRCRHLPARAVTAAAIDEEKSYAYFHGYVAYRFGYRADAVTSWCLAEHLFGPSQRHANQQAEAARESGIPQDATPHGFHILLEDMSLNFPDRRSDTHLLRLEACGEAGNRQGRAHHLPKLDSTSIAENSALRILVTTGQGMAPYADALDANRRYLLQEKRTGRGLVTLKPAGGMFALWHEASLLRRTTGCRRRGDAEGFVWPTRPADFQDGGETDPEGLGHGAPGRMMLIAEHLLARAEAIHEATTGVLRDVQGAVLATDASELLGGRTPTLAAQTLVLKHLLEVKAECHFSGVEFHFEVQPRADEIELEAEAVASWFDKSERENARLNVLMTCGNRLAGLLRDQNQYDEEQYWMNRARHWHYSLWMRAKAWRYFYWPFLRYGEVLLSSFQTFCLFIGIWIAGLTGAFAIVRPFAAKGVPGPGDELQTFGQAMSSFFGSSTFESGNPTWIALTVIAVLAGFVHLGILISHLYSLVTRK